MEVRLINSMGSDRTVVDAARVSFHKTADNYTDEQNERLIKYLADHNHWTPFGHATATFHVTAPVFVARQLAKHQVGLVWNEVSRRYVDDDPEFYTPRTWRPRSPDKKQGSVRDDNIGNLRAAWSLYDDAVQGCVDAYDNLLILGVAPEQARMILPQSMMTEWYWTGSLAAWSRVCRLRISEDVQPETEEIARMISEHMEELFPASWEALNA